MVTAPLHYCSTSRWKFLVQWWAKTNLPQKSLQKSSQESPRKSPWTITRFTRCNDLDNWGQKRDHEQQNFFYPNNSTSPKRAARFFKNGKIKVMAKLTCNPIQGRTGDTQGTTCFENRFPAMWTGSLKLEQVFPVIKADFLFENVGTGNICFHQVRGSSLQCWVRTILNKC